jgi:Protein of unknown function (DUF938)
MVPAGARTSPSTARNREPILAVLRAWLPARGLVLEIAAGAGEHAVFNAAALPGLVWQPTDPDDTALASTAAWRDAAALPNVLAPLRLDACEPDAWPVSQADALVNINMIHISPWAAAEGLMAGAGRLLRPGAPLVLYGPFIERDVETAASNLAFDASLRARNPEWGIRRLDEVVALAVASGFELVARVEMPANNLMVVFRKA